MSEPYHKDTYGAIAFEQTTWDQVNPPTTYRIPMEWVRYVDGWTNPTWRSDVALKRNATTPFEGIDLSVEHSDGTLILEGTADGQPEPDNLRIQGKQGWLTFSDGRSSLASNLLDEGAESDASSRFYSQLSSALKALEGGELVGELGKTAKSLILTSKYLVATLNSWKRAVRRAKNSSARRRAGIVSSSYLQWKFGWDPLVKDVLALTDSLVDDYVTYIPFSVTGHNTPASASYVQAEYTGMLEYDTTVVAKAQSTVRYKGDFVVNRTGIGGLVERMGISPSNFLPTLYNLLPWTYMLDYFSNLGDIVQAIASVDVGSNVAWCCRTVRNTSTTTYSSGHSVRVVPGITPNPGYPIVIPSTTIWTNKYVARTAALPSRIPGLRLRVPNFQTEAGRTKGLNIAAVLAARTWSSGLFRSITSRG